VGLCGAELQNQWFGHNEGKRYMDVVRRLLALLCAVVCASCPCLIGWLSATYAETGFDADYQPWPVYVVDGLFWLALGSTVGLICSLRSWWRLVGAIIAVPLLVFTAVLAVTGGMWIEGTYF
jgi:hypothetical protein